LVDRTIGGDEDGGEAFDCHLFGDRQIFYAICFAPTGFAIGGMTLPLTRQIAHDQLAAYTMNLAKIIKSLQPKAGGQNQGASTTPLFLVC
jgi:hypothetical protein